MVDPIKSKHQAEPWQPNVDPSSKGKKDQQTAANDYDAIYGGSPTKIKDDGSKTDNGTVVAMPDLTDAYSTAPDFVPSQSPNSSGTPSDGLPGGSFSIDLGALRTAEQACMTATQTSTHGYEAVLKTVRSAINNPNLFGQNVGHWETKHGKAAAETGTDHPIWHLNELDSEAKAFGDAINPQLSKLMVAGAGAIEVMGAFTALLNNAGQMYTYTDSNSVFPGS
ncbi:hypothetical protein OG552_30550 [Streptomyces sp. NBC_01476]|uniref:hypothetical protein n=1 Tax=Streptomyces sp. NBC_01476 TaxID=2903881 RepID=UPI002E34B0BC|nr:hypothetical protein [Streptomyces sp. NBC_01476]